MLNVGAQCKVHLYPFLDKVVHCSYARSCSFKQCSVYDICSCININSLMFSECEGHQAVQG